MGFVSSALRKIVFWNYPRTSWQWDVICVLCLVFIFLTPKSWFANTSAPQATVVLGVEVVGTQGDNEEIGRRAKQAAKRPNGQVTGIRALYDNDHKLTGYEVDIR
jgi:hypothetical protein